MIQSISIENYRCFHKTHLEGFRLINLIGGKNNAGKTALLEAIYILMKPFEAVRQIQKYREEENHRSTKNFFHKSNIELPIAIVAIDSTSTLSYIYNNPEQLQNDSLRDKFINKQNIKNINLFSFSGHALDGNRQSSQKNIINLIPSSGTKSTNSDIVNLYSEARKNDLNTRDSLLSGFKALDEDVDFVELLIESEPMLHIQRKGQLPYPIKTYGDAMNRIAEFILRIVSSPDGILLIDEIENGIHHDTQQKIWEILFTLAIRHKVQIFATTHSLEMIKAFESVAQMHKAEAMYVEMYKSVRSNEIAANFQDMDLLSYELRNDLTIRGEQ